MLWRRIRQALNRPIDGASLAAFRVAFGAVMAGEALCGFYWIYNGRFRLVLDPASFHFAYYGFGWVRPCGESWHVVLCAAALLAGFGVAAGVWPRVSAAVFFLVSSYFFLIEKALYVNHHYLICLIAFLLIFVPARGDRKVPAL